MDNLSHSIAGWIAAEAALALSQMKPKHHSEKPLPSFNLRRSAITLSIVGNNLPDTDIIYTPIESRPLGYLLHHRGHTHTVLVGVIMAALVYGAFMWFKRHEPFSNKERLALFILTLLGPLLHLALDGTNNYGIHPFWPWDSSWIFGDTIFIIEPLYWAITFPFIMMKFSQHAKPWVRILVPGLLWALVSGIMILLIWNPLGSMVALFLFCMFFAVSFLISRKRFSLTWIIGASLTVTASFALGKVWAQKHSQRHAPSHAPPEWSNIDTVYTPFPSNPGCWNTKSLEQAGNQLQLRTDAFCLHPLTTLPPRQKDSVTHRYHASDLHALNARCDGAAYLKFSRLPYYKPDNRFADDLRYHDTQRRSFASFILPEIPKCPKYVPDWTPPRDKLLRQGSRLQMPEPSQR